MKRKTPLLYGPLIGAHMRDLRIERGMSLHGLHSWRAYAFANFVYRKGKIGFQHRNVGPNREDSRGTPRRTLAERAVRCGEVGRRGTG